MPLLEELLNRIRYLGRRVPLEDTLDDEIRFHLETRAAGLEATGLPHRDAVDQARREFGPVARMRENSRAAWQFHWLTDALADLRYAARAFLRSPGFTLTAVLSLALGIGANSAIFTALDAALWKPLPVADPYSLVRVAVTRANRQDTEQIVAGFARTLRRSGVFADATTVEADGLSLAYDGPAERMIAEFVSPNYFTFLGVEPILGQAFTPGVREGHWAAEAVLSYNYWKRRFAGDPAVIGRAIRLNGYPFTIVGVTPPSFFGVTQGADHELRIPVLPEGQTLSQIAELSGADNHPSNVMARLKPGQTIAQAESAADAQFQEFLRTTTIARLRNTGLGHLRVRPAARGWSADLEGFASPLAVLAGLVAMVLLIACGNVANMLLARATARRRELAVRVSIGAGRARLIRQMLAESLLLALVGGTLGIAVAAWVDRLLLHFLPQGHIRWVVDLHPDARALLFTAALSIATGFLFGLIPALQCTRGDLAASLKTDSSASIGEPRGAYLRKTLVAAQVAFSLVLLVVAGLFVRTLANLRPTDYHVQPEQVLLFTMKPQQELYTPDHIRTLTSEMIRRVSALPGVRTAAFAENGPLGSRTDWSSIRAPGGEFIRANDDAVTPGFFDSIGLPLIAGRDFTPADRPGAPRVVVVNQALARAVFADQNPMGRILEVRNVTEKYQVVGVVADAHYYQIHEAPQPTVYFSGMQDGLYMPTLHVRTGSPDHAAVVSAVLREFNALDRGFPVFNVRTFELRIADSLARERMVADLSAALGLLAMTLAAVGLYGILVYSVSRRTREIGLRMALGSSGRQVLWLVVREALQLVAAGSVAGLLIALAAGRLLSRYLYGVSSFDPQTLAVSAAAMLLIAAIAVTIPALRATRVDPLHALRYE
ncbi:MAG TPA: ABC transporter permease [Bryobacteraceae bacterium]|nr:ABC transporter permease [Bryobacteraceae bacterium]